MAAAGARIALLLEGSRGDTQPYIVLAKALSKAGFTVRYFTNCNHTAFITSHGIDVRGLGSDCELFIQEDKDIQESMKTGDFFKFVAALNNERAQSDFKKSIKPYWDALDEFKPELLVCGPITTALGLFYQYARRVPYVRCELQANMATREWGPYGLPTLPAWTGLNLKLWKLAFSSFHGQTVTKRAMVEEVLKIDLSAPTSQSWYVDKLMHKCPLITPVIMGISPSFSKRAKDWPSSNITISGWWVEDKQDQAERAKQGDSMYGGADGSKLSDFLKAGAPPVYMGWGSMLAVSKEYMACLAVRALKGAERRGIILGGWAELSLECLAGAPDEKELRAYCQDNVLFMKTAPHAWLFPQCACAVHHGGSGTMAASVMAGIPTIITPVFLDQWDYAALLNKEGCGVGLNGLSKVTLSELVAAIKKCCTDGKVIESAKAMGKACSSEDGTGTAVKVITDFYVNRVNTGQWQKDYEKEVELYKPKPSKFCCLST